MDLKWKINANQVYTSPEGEEETKATMTNLINKKMKKIQKAPESLKIDSPILELQETVTYISSS